MSCGPLQYRTKTHKGVTMWVEKNRKIFHQKQLFLDLHFYRANDFAVILMPFLHLPLLLLRSHPPSRPPPCHRVAVYSPAHCHFNQFHVSFAGENRKGVSKRLPYQSNNRHWTFCSHHRRGSTRQTRHAMPRRRIIFQAFPSLSVCHCSTGRQTEENPMKWLRGLENENK